MHSQEESKPSVLPRIWNLANDIYIVDGRDQQEIERGVRKGCMQVLGES